MAVTMFQHAPILPILIPFAATLLLLAAADRGLAFQRAIGLAAALAGVAAAAWLTLLADRGEVLVYALGDWPAPFGIVLAADRLAAGMTLTTALLAAVCLLHASHGFDARGRHFHPFFQLQIVGLQGAFLTGDLFNLFVFFEVMLLASYALLAHGGGLARTRAGLAYVVLNLAGSALFLIALGLLYGTLGTLNLADVALRLQGTGHDPALARLAAALLIAVFALKAALLPLSFWLPLSYAAAGAPAAALFAIMTKVGIVAILRVQAIAFAPAPATADLLAGWLTPLALATVLFAALGALAAARLRELAAWLVLGSAGALLAVPAHAGTAVTAAALYYLVQSTFAVAVFFLLAERIAERRGAAADGFRAGPAPAAPWLALGFFLAATTVSGLPPFSGFIGKLMLLEAFRPTPAAAAVWSVLLTAGFLVMASLARNGSRLFWEHKPAPAGPPQGGAANDMERAQPANLRHPLPREGGGGMAVPSTGWRRATAIALLVAAGPLLALFARPVADYAARAAAQLHAPKAYIAAVLGEDTRSIWRQRLP